MTICSRCDVAEAVGFIDEEGLFVEVDDPWDVGDFGFDPLCPACAEFLMALSELNLSNEED